MCDTQISCVVFFQMVMQSTVRGRHEKYFKNAKSDVYAKQNISIYIYLLFAYVMSYIHLALFVIPKSRSLMFPDLVEAHFLIIR